MPNVETQAKEAANGIVPDGLDHGAAFIRARRLRSQYLTVLLTGLVKKIVGWNRNHVLHRRLENMPDYLLKDIGIRHDQIGALVSGSLRRDPLALSPVSIQSAPAFQGVTPSAAENTNSDTEKRLAA